MDRHCAHSEMRYIQNNTVHTITTESFLFVNNRLELRQNKYPIHTDVYEEDNDNNKRKYNWIFSSRERSVQYYNT